MDPQDSVETTEQARRDQPNGDELFSLVDRYHTLGHHRVGGVVDRATVDWFAQHLEARSLTVEREAVPFPHATATSSLTVDGDPVTHLVVPYEFSGSVHTTAPHVVLIDPHSGGFPSTLDAPCAAAKAAGADAVIIATDHPNGSLVGINRPLDAGSGLATVLVAGRDHERLRTGAIELRIDAEVASGTTTNVIGRNRTSPDAGPPLLLTTPLTGWFGCAGERATGIAVLLHLVERFHDRPLLVVATGGHEISYFGAKFWAERNADIDVLATIHVGASVAVDAPDDHGGRTLVPTRIAMTSISEADATDAATALATIGLDLTTGADSWIGEGEVFCHLDAPLLSFTGAGVDFHTPEDTPERATSPDALAAVAKAIGDAVEAITDVLGRPAS